MLRLPHMGLVVAGLLVLTGGTYAADKDKTLKREESSYDPARDPNFNPNVDEVPFVEGQKPPAAQEGEIWCLVTKSAMTRKVTEQVMVRPGTFYYETLPAKYSWKEERVMIAPETKQAIPVPPVYRKELVKKLVKPESFEYQTVPPVYEWVDEVVEVAPEKESITVSGAKYKTVTEQVMVEPARTEWQKVDCDDRGVIISRRESKDDCYAIVTIPPKYQTVTRQVLDQDITTDTTRVRNATRVIKVQKLVKEAEVKKVLIPAVYDEYEREVLVQPASVRYETVPPVYDVVKKMVMIEPEAKRKVEVPPKYEMVTKEVIDQPAMLVWRRKKGDALPKKEVVEKPDLVERYGSVPGITSDDAEKQAKEKEKKNNK